jgi:hypothetical protein
VIHREHRADIAEIARRHEQELAAIGQEVADAVHALIPDCSAAVVLAETGPEWRMLAQAGPDDLEHSWRRLVAGASRVTHSWVGQDEALVAPLSSARISAMLVAVPRRGASLARSTGQVVRPLLDAGAILLDAALSDDLERLRREPDAAPAPAPWFRIAHGVGC